jgi:hypothetical protein
MQEQLLTPEEYDMVVKAIGYVNSYTYTIDDWFESRGFDLTDTGGNCWAYLYYFENTEMNLLVTDDGGCELPTRLGETCIIGTYNFEGDFVATCKMTVFDLIDLWD